MSKSCPACREALASVSFGGVTVDGCHQCGGVWFDRGELTRLAQDDLTQLAAMDQAFEEVAGSRAPANAAGPCPTCGTELARFEPPQTPGLSLTGCPAGHGTWLGEDEFEQIIERLEQWRAQQGRAPRTAAPPARQRLRDIAHLLLSQPCPKCQQPNATASPVCWACGGMLPSAKVRFCCPGCSRGLDSLVYEGILLNHCEDCGGLWLDRGELGAVIQLAQETLQQLQRRLQPASPAASPQASTASPCPTCRVTMHYHEYGVGSGVLIHLCEGCRGVWVDHAALVPIQQFALANENFLPPDAA